MLGKHITQNLEQAQRLEEKVSFKIVEISCTNWGGIQLLNNLVFNRYTVATTLFCQLALYLGFNLVVFQYSVLKNFILDFLQKRISCGLFINFQVVFSRLGVGPLRGVGHYMLKEIIVLQQTMTIVQLYKQCVIVAYIYIICIIWIL
eukprot:TRINITY_DN7064_c1_g1_i3.p2 TRINITY_DN7064_c1_g1~~TRINITY_DN7064_c1_g1_i3.p2  ORF type:complete len:147 (-),score=4.18 TRINITY_DN7064_c1_g1_i3:16-456(-)